MPFVGDGTSVPRAANDAKVGTITVSPAPFNVAIMVVQLK